jgi:hypothetical protein
MGDRVGYRDTWSTSLSPKADLDLVAGLNFGPASNVNH